MLKENPLTTDLVGDKTTKTDERVAFFGAVDELSAHIMELTHYIEDVPMQMELRKIVSMLSTMMAEVAGGLGHIGEKHLNELIEVKKNMKSRQGRLQALCCPVPRLWAPGCMSCARLRAVRSSPMPRFTKSMAEADTSLNISTKCQRSSTPLRASMTSVNI